MRPRFLTGLFVRESQHSWKKTQWELVKDLKFYTAIQQCEITVPKGFVTDFASVPRIPIVFWFVGDIANKPAVIHDFLYRRQIYTKKIADNIFLEAMKVNEVSLIRRKVMYLAVKWFGRSTYQRYKSANA